MVSRTPGSRSVPHTTGDPALSILRSAVLSLQFTAMAQPNKMTSWPDAAPLIGEELIVTISCGNSHLNWATHLGEEEEFNPHIFWRCVYPSSLLFPLLIIFPKYGKLTFTRAVHAISEPMLS